MVEDLINLKLLVDNDQAASEHQSLGTYRNMLTAVISDMIELNNHHFTPDASKLLDAGYTLIRTQDNPDPIIKFKQGSIREWRTLEKGFASKAARDRRFKELLNDFKTIQA